jgi:hypothetical protein
MVVGHKVEILMEPLPSTLTTASWFRVVPSDSILSKESLIRSVARVDADENDKRAKNMKTRKKYLNCLKTIPYSSITEFNEHCNLRKKW